MTLVAPGTPAVVLPKFEWPALRAVPKRLGGIVTDIRLENLAGAAQQAVPFTKGHAFVEGDMLPMDGLLARMPDGSEFPLQVNHKASHADGTVRHSVISGMIPRLPTGEAEVLLVRTPAPAKKQMAPITPTDFRVRILHAGVEYFATAQGGAGQTWIDGAIVTEDRRLVPIVTADGVEHKSLRVQFATRRYHATGQTRTDVVVEHSHPFVRIGDITYDVEIQAADGTVLWSQTALVHTHTARFRRLFWSDGAPALHVKHNSAYLIRTKQVSPYDLSKPVSEVALAAHARMLGLGKFGPMQFGRVAPAMGGTGGRPEIGLMPDVYAAAVISMDRRAHALMLATADCAGSWPIHRRDYSDGPAAGMPMDVVHWPRATVMGNPDDSLNRLTGQEEYLWRDRMTTSLGKPDTSHQPAFAYLPYLLEGDCYYLEELHFWNNFNLYAPNPGYRGSEKGLIYSGQARGQAWCLRTLAETAYITPDDHYSKSACMFWLDNNIEYYKARYVDKTVAVNGKPFPLPYDPAKLPADAVKRAAELAKQNAEIATRPVSDLGCLTDGYADEYLGDTGVAPWQDDFFTQSLGHAAALGHAGAKSLMQWKGRFVVERMIGPGACWIDAPIYALRVRESAMGPFYQTIGQCYAATLAPAISALPCGSPERLAAQNAADKSAMILGEMDGYAINPTGYPANMQPALAAAVDAGVPGAAEAWAVYEKRSKPQNYSAQPQFSIVPFAQAVVVPTEPTIPVPPVEPPPVVVPPVEPPVIPPVEPPVIPPVEPTPDPQPQFFELAITSPALVGQPNLRMLVADLAGPAIIVLNAEADAAGTARAKSTGLALGRVYIAVVTGATNEILASGFPLMAAPI